MNKTNIINKEKIKLVRKQFRISNENRKYTDKTHCSKFDKARNAPVDGQTVTPLLRAFHSFT